MSNSNELYFKNIEISYMEKVNDFLLIALNNGQKILTNGKDIYDISSYYHLSDLFNMGDKLCAVLIKGFKRYVVDLKTMEVLFEDEAYLISKLDERTLHVVMQIGEGDSAIYDIEAKKYLPSPKNYKFENSLGNNLYVFRDDYNSNIDFYDCKRCVINIDGKIILKDIEGRIDLCDKYLIIKKRNELCIVKINDDNSLNMNTITQTKELIATPKFYDGHIIIMEKGLIKLFTPNLDLVNQFHIKELDSVLDFEVISDVLKILLPCTIAGEKVNKHLFVNLKTGKAISNIRIDGYPYWSPEVYVGKDNLSNDELCNLEYDKTYEQIEYHFYDADFNKIAAVKGTFYSEIDANIFMVSTWDGKKIHRKYVNAKTGVVKDCNYDEIKFSPDNLYGYAFNTLTDMLDIVDRDLSVIIPNIDYKKIGLSKSNDFFSQFSYFIVNDYVCITKYIPNGPKTCFRNIIQNANGEIILDSFEHKCYPIGNLIQIIKNGKTEYLNTLTGEKGKLSLTAHIEENGKIDFNKVEDLNKMFQIENKEQLLLSTDSESQKVKKLIPNTNKDN